MLQTIREYTQGWIAGFIISIVIMSFALWGIHSYFVGGGADSIVAQVNSSEISREQLNVAFERLRRQVQVQFGTNTAASANDAAIKERALHDLIDMEVLKQASTNQGFIISDLQVDSYLQSMPQFQVNGQFSLQRLQEVIIAAAMNPGELVTLIKNSLLIEQPKVGIIFSSFALPDETDYTISLVNQERDIAYATIPIQYFLSQPIVIPADKIKSYYDQHQNEFMTPEQVNIEYLQLSLQDIAAKVNPTDVLLKAYYNDNINSYTQPMLWKFTEINIPVNTDATPDEIAKLQHNAEAVIAALNKHQDVAKVAQANSAKVTDHDWMSMNQVPAELQKQVADMNKPGQVSTQPFRTANGFTIIKMIDIRQPQIQAYDKVKDKVKESYVRQNAEEKFASLRDQLADTAYEHPDSLAFSAKTLGLPILTSANFTKVAGKDISQSQKVRDVAFSNDVLNLQNNSDLVQVDPETVIVLRVKSHAAPALLPLTAVASKIEDKLKATIAEENAIKLTTEINTKLQSGADPQALLAQYKFSWTQVGLIGRHSNKIDPAISDVAFRLPNPANANNKMTYGIAKLANGYAIVGLKSVQSGTIDDAKERSIFAEQVENSDGALEYALYKQSQIARSSISIR